MAMAGGSRRTYDYDTQTRLPARRGSTGHTGTGRSQKHLRENKIIHHFHGP